MALMSSIKIYQRHNLDQVPWPEHKDGLYARNWLLPLVQHGSLAFFDNIDVEVQILCCDDLVFPIVLANPHALIKNSYVCSPSTHYLDYAQDEIRMEMNDTPHLQACLGRMIQALRQVFLPLNFEKVIYVNNWLLSTNLYPDFNAQNLADIRDFLITRFPNHALIFRSVNLQLNQEIFQTLKELRFADIVSRQVYILDPSKGQHKKKNPYKEDVRLDKKTPYHWIEHEELQTHQIPRLRWLYDDLYLRKYSYLNPQFNELFIRESLKNNWLRYYALTHEGQIQAMMGYFERNGVFTTPMVGYNCALPKKTGLYRLLTLRLIREAEAQGWILNHSSGVARFKTLRGCEPSMEYNMVYYRHLPRTQQIPWRSLQGISRTMIGPILEKMAL